MVIYFAITSTYRPLFLGFFCPGLRGPAAPSKSSMLLALLMLVVGRLGGLLGGPLGPGGPVALVFDTDLAIGAPLRLS